MLVDLVVVSTIIVTFITVLCCSMLFLFARNIKKHFTVFWCLISDCRSFPKVCGLLGFFILSMRLSYFVQTNAAAKRKVQQGEQVRCRRCRDPWDWSRSLLKAVPGKLHFSGTHALKSKIIQIQMLIGHSWRAFPSFSHHLPCVSPAMIAFVVPWRPFRPTRTARPKTKSQRMGCRGNSRTEWIGWLGLPDFKWGGSENGGTPSSHHFSSNWDGDCTW